MINEGTKLEYAILLTQRQPVDDLTVDVSVINTTGSPKYSFERKGVKWGVIRNGLKHVQLDPSDKPDLIPFLVKGTHFCEVHAHCSANDLIQAGIVQK
jgi:hypothetical protein